MVATLVGVAFLVAVAVDLLKLLAKALFPSASKSKWWAFGVRLLSVLIGAGTGYVLVESSPLWGTIIGAIAGSFNAAIRSKVRLELKKKET